MFKRADVCQRYYQQGLGFYKLNWDGIFTPVKRNGISMWNELWYNLVIQPGKKINHLNKSNCSLMKIFSFLSQMLLIRVWFCWKLLELLDVHPCVISWHAYKSTISPICGFLNPILQVLSQIAAYSLAALAKKSLLSATCLLQISTRS